MAHDEFKEQNDIRASLRNNYSWGTVLFLGLPIGYSVKKGDHSITQQSLA